MTVDIAAGERVPLYSPEFAADPQAPTAYAERFGSLVPVELVPGIRATLVIGYRTAVQILNDPDHFPADPKMWQRDIPADCPVLPMMRYRPNAFAPRARSTRATGRPLSRVSRESTCTSCIAPSNSSPSR